MKHLRYIVFIGLTLLLTSLAIPIEVYGRAPLSLYLLTPDDSVATVTTTGTDLAFYDDYPFIILVNTDEDVNLIDLSDDDFLDKAGRVVFKVNRYDVFTNDSLLGLLENVIIPRINSDSLRARRLVVRGAASPEGPVSNNRMLGRRRVEALANFLRARLSVPVDEDSFTSEAVTEDYRLLLAMMRRANDPAYDEVKALCDIHLPRYEFSLLKRKMQRLQGGRLWVRLLRTYFPDLRAARVVLFLEKPAQPISPIGPIGPISPKDTIAQPSWTPEPSGSYTAYGAEVVIPRREILSVKTNLLLDAAYMPGYDRWCPIPNIAVEYYPLKGHFTYGASFDCPWWQHYWDYKFFQFRNYQLETRYYLKASTPSKPSKASKPSKPSTPSRASKPAGTYDFYGSFEDYWAKESPEALEARAAIAAADAANGLEAIDGTEALGGLDASYKAPAFSGLYFSAYTHAALYGICFGERRGWVGEGAGAGLGIGYVMPISRNGHWRLEFSAQAGIFLTKYDPYQFENPVNPNYRDHLYYYKWTGDADLFKKRQYRFTWLGPTRIGITLSYDLLYRRVQKKGVSFKSTERRAHE